MHEYIKFLACHLEAVATGKKRRVVITLPPRHLKTFLASICLPAWIVAHNPSATILLLSYGQELADKIAYAIREIFAQRLVLPAFQSANRQARAHRLHHHNQRLRPLRLDRRQRHRLRR